MAATPAPGMLRVRKLADRSDGERVTLWHPQTGERYLTRPETRDAMMTDPQLLLAFALDPSSAHEPWPLLGVRIEGEPPAACNPPTSFVERGMEEGWIEVEGARPAHRPGGPPANEWKVTHTFLHADAIVIKTVDGDVRYVVVHQPDKYVDTGDGGEPDDEPMTDDAYAAGDSRVDWFYGLQRETEG